MINYKGVSIVRKKVTILENINLSLNAGDFAYLTGNVGSGKSSLLKTIYAEIPVETGTAKVAGYSLNDIERNEIPYLRRKLGIIFQDYRLLNDRNIYDNLKFVLEAAEISDRKEIRNRISEVISKVNLEGRENKMPYELSGGEQQRAGIARAIVNNPQIILADEPTGNLDPDSYYSIMEILVKLAKAGTCVLIATHNQELIEKYPGINYHIENKTLRLI